MSTTPSGNHESPKSKILKRKKARSNTPLSCKIEYYIKTNSAYFSDQSAFFTDDLIIRDRYIERAFGGTRAIAIAEAEVFARAHGCTFRYRIKRQGEFTRAYPAGGRA
jgi:hypothetical protein